MVAAELAEAPYPEGSVLGVDAGSGCLGGKDGWRVVGKGSVVLYSQGTWRRFQSGESVPLSFGLVDRMPGLQKRKESSR